MFNLRVRAILNHAGRARSQREVFSGRQRTVCCYMCIYIYVCTWFQHKITSCEVHSPRASGGIRCGPVHKKQKANLVVEVKRCNLNVAPYIVGFHCVKQPERCTDGGTMCVVRCSNGARSFRACKNVAPVDLQELAKAATLAQLAAPREDEVFF